MNSIKKIFFEDVKQKSKMRPRLIMAKKRPKKIIMPYELNKDDEAYQPGEVHVSKLPRCPVCKKFFEKKDSQQKYCSCECAMKMRIREFREQRKK